jgi:hypothetical protein
MFLNLTVSMLISVAIALPLHAALSEALKELTFGFRAYQIAVNQAIDSGVDSAGKFSASAQSCGQLIEKARAAGVQPDDLIAGVSAHSVPEAYPFSKAPELCENYRRWKLTIQAAKYLDGISTGMGHALSSEPGRMEGKYALKVAEDGRACLSEVNKLVAAGAYADKKVKHLNYKEQTITEARALCQKVVDWSAGFAKLTDKTRKDKADAIRAKYVKAGLKGDRLGHFIHYDNVQWKVSGCRNENDMNRLKKAQKLFQWLEHNDGTYGIRTFIFKGDKLLSVTDKKYLTSVAAMAGCK